MLFLWIFVLAIYVVNCDVSENYILEMPDRDVPKAHNTPFKVYWNVPTKQCRYQKNSIPFDNILQKYGISYNRNDKFEGDTITIIYDGGYMPAILKSDGAKYSIRNGGLPQEGNLELHLTVFRETVIRLIPDPNFKGLGIIDMENWRPIFRQHWSKLANVIDLSLSMEKRQYWWWPTSWLKMEATKRFEDAARIFMEKTLSTAKQMRPKAVWGYYGFPFCFNMGKDMEEHCSKTVKEENDRTYWLWAESTALYPSIYSPSQFSTSELEALVRGRLIEANRVKQAGTLVLPYFWIKYRDGGFFKEKDLIAVFETLQRKNASGLVIWGSSDDVNLFEKCEKLYNYVNSSLGPIAKKYIQRINKIYNDKNKADSKNVNVFNGTSNNAVTTTHKPILNNDDESTHNNLITTEKSENISYMITEQDQLSKYLYETDDNKIDVKSFNESDIWGIISYSTESIKHTKPYFDLSTTYQIISYKNTSLNNDLSITAKISINDSSNVFNNISDNLFREIENSTSSTILTTNNTGKVILNDLIRSEVNLMTPMKTSVYFNVTEITTETDPQFIQTIELEQQLNNYFYETDDNEANISSNESDIWSIISGVYQKNLVQKEGAISMNGTQYARNPESLNQKYTESYYDNNTSTTGKTISNKDTSLNKYLSATDKILSEIDSANIFKTKSQPMFKIIKNNTNPNTETMNSNITNHLKDLPILTIQPKSRNSSVNRNNSEIVMKTDPIPTMSTTKIITEFAHNFDNKRHFTNESSDNIEEMVNKENKSSDVNATGPMNIIPENGNNYYYSQNVSQKERKIENTTYQNTIASDNRENDFSDYLITVQVNFNNSLNTPEKDYDIKIHENLNPETTIEFTTLNNEALFKKENDISDYLITVAVNLTSPMNTSVNDSDVEITFENSESENRQDLPSNNYGTDSNDISQNVTQEEQIIDTVTFPEIEAITNIEDDISNHSVPPAGNSTSSIVSIVIKGNDSGIIENVKTRNSLETTLLLPNDFSKDMSQNLKQDEQLIKNTTHPNNEETISTENDTSINPVISAEDSTILLTRVVNESDALIMEFNMKAENRVESVSLPNNFLRDISLNVKQDEQLIKHSTNPNVVATISIEDDILQNSAENSTVPIPRLLNGSDAGINENEETENSLESTLLLPYNFSRGIPETVNENEQRIENIFYPNNEDMITTANGISDNLVTSAGNSTSPKTTLVSINDTDIIENVEAGNSLELLLPKNFSKDISQKVKENDQLKNTTYTNNETTISAENNIPDYLVASARNSTSHETTLVNSNDTGITPNNFSIDISQNVKLDEQFIRNTTYANIETSVSRESNVSEVSDYLIILTEENNCMNTSVNSNDATVMENVKSESSLELTSSSKINFSMDSQSIDQAEQLNENTLYSKTEATARGENDFPDYLITLARESNSINTSVNANEIDKVIENYEADENDIDLETSNDIDIY
ncbi:putative uncharacterized protein DDB_G0282133 [Maniola jurtina]|uniref:putative uncharacterized protein DDB_G0282133 n=1 Tax=Maniola jurtina TaxID=191418 RepID=UPI001E68AA11|nr:putative uncharacterized protein DDB_G0282133 [Maniola jurtina]